ncbi:MAG TPA: hypothetical protein VNH18_14105, partial [Bryobacteraceae bacterium]|nr:hypothetical protein [Bryobacteraceae bacterium]
TLLRLHGEGGDENDLPPIAKAIAGGAAVLSPRVQPAGANPNEVAATTAGLAHWLATAFEEYQLDPKRVFALGYANGANLASSLLLLFPGLLAGAILLRPQRVIEPEPLPNLSGIPVLVAGGDGDETMAPGESEQLARLLSHAGADVDYAVAPSGHDLTPQDFSMCKRWLDEMLPGRAKT